MQVNTKVYAVDLQTNYDHVTIANLFDNLIQLVNIIGSIFYGNVLGVFLLAFFFKFVKLSEIFGEFNKQDEKFKFDDTIKEIEI